MNFLVCLSFIGTNYHGSQIQDNAVTIQSVFQDALASVLTPLPDIKCCSRTDAGVHAKKFYLNFKLEEPHFTEDKLLHVLNRILPSDIRVMSVRIVPDEFHARYSAIAKQYDYYIWNNRIESPFWINRAYHYGPFLDISKMNEVAPLFIGTHDFSSFTSKKCSVEDRNRTITKLQVRRTEDLIRITIQADGFLYNMARIIAGCLFQCAIGKVDVDDIQSYLSGKPRDNRLITLPAHGLYLSEVTYSFES